MGAEEIKDPFKGSGLFGGPESGSHLTMMILRSRLFSGAWLGEQEGRKSADRHSGSVVFFFFLGR